LSQRSVWVLPTTRLSSTRILEMEHSSKTTPSSLRQLVALATSGAFPAHLVAPLAASSECDMVVSKIQAVLPLQSMDKSAYEAALTSIFAQAGIETAPSSSSAPPTPPSEGQAKLGTPTSSSCAPTSPLPPSTEHPADPEELIMLCIDVSGSMQTPFEVDPDERIKDRTRLDAVKQCFYGFRDQTQRLAQKGGGAGQLWLGLLSFDHETTVHMHPSSNLSVFEDVLDDMSPRGGTAIYAAVEKACSVLRPLHARYPNAYTRIIVLSDGQNNNTHVSSDEALRALQEVDAVCDCMLMAQRADDHLRRLVSASEGVAVDILSLADCFEALESASMISLTARNGESKPDFAGRRPSKPRVESLASVELAGRVRGTVAPASSFPSASSFASSSPPTYYTLPNALAHMDKGRAGSKRIAKDLAALGTMATVRCFPGLNSSGRVQDVKVFLSPADGPYAGYAYEMRVTFPANFPFSPPRLWFVTEMYHYAVSTSGDVCLEELKDGWSPASTLGKVLVSLEALLTDYRTVDPNADQGLRSWLSELLRTDPQEYYRLLREHNVQHACSLPIPETP